MNPTNRHYTEENVRTQSVIHSIDYSGIFFLNKRKSHVSISVFYSSSQLCLTSMRLNAFVENGSRVNLFGPSDQL